MACPFGGAMKRPARVPSQLSDSLPPRLNAYALAAGAAGLGRLALPQPVEARIVYTRANEVIQGGSLLLDLNHDGITDFVFQRNLSAHFSTSLRIGAYNNSNRTWGSQNKKNGQKLASAL